MRRGARADRRSRAETIDGSASAQKGTKKETVELAWGTSTQAPSMHDAGLDTGGLFPFEISRRSNRRR